MPLIPPILRKYKANYKCFIETGTYEGDTVALALSEGFDRVFSIELNESRYVAAINRFKADARVTIIKGDSSEELPKLLSTLDCPIFFWLDAHLDGPVNAPLHEELLSIQKHPIKEHRILIDDVRRFGEYLLNASKENMTQRILSINPNYKIFYENDGLSVDDVMVAYV